MLKQIHNLEEQLATLLTYLQQVQDDNRLLREQLAQSQLDQQSLRERMHAAQTRIDRVIDRLTEPSGAAEPIDPPRTENA